MSTATSTGESVAKERGGPSPVVTAWFIAFVAAAAYCAYSVMQWRTFSVPSWDLGIFTQLAQQYSDLASPIVDIKGPDFNLLGDHFHPILVVLGPIFAMFPSGLTLLIVQNLLFALSSVPITLVAAHKLGHARAAIIGAGYALSWGLWSAIASQFHEIAFAVPLLAYGLARWLDTGGRSRSAIIAIALLVFVKEDMGLTVAMVGVVFAWQAWGGQARKHSRIGLRSLANLKEATHTRLFRIGTYLIVWGIAWTLLTILVILPSLNPNGAWDYTSRLGSTDSMSSILSFFTPTTKYITLALLSYAAGIIGIFSPYMWIMLPTLVWRFAGNTEFYWGWEWHYSAILIPVAAIALIDASARWRGSKHITLGAALLSLASGCGVSATGALGDLWQGRTSYSVSDQEARAARGALNALGTGRNVVADLQMLAYAVPENRVFWVGSVGDADVDAVIVGPSHAASRTGASVDTWASSHFGGSWELVYSDQGFEVALRG